MYKRQGEELQAVGDGHPDDNRGDDGDPHGGHGVARAPHHAGEDVYKRQLCLCTGSLGCAKFNDAPALVRKYSAAGRIGFMHLRNVKILEDGSFEERAHLSSCGSLDMYAIVKALVETGFDGYVRPDHGRMIWGETGKPGYGLYDRALGAAYINGLFEACEKAQKGQ